MTMRANTLSVGDLIAALHDEVDASTADAELAAHLAAMSTLEVLVRNGNFQVAAELAADNLAQA